MYNLKEIIYRIKELLRLKRNIKVNIGLFPNISKANITTFPGTSLLPEWKLG